MKSSYWGYNAVCLTLLRDPTEVETKVEEKRTAGTWNGEYYACFDSGFDWEAARKHGFLQAGGGIWYSRTLNLAEKGSRVWVNVPGMGYVGVGEIIGPKQSAHDFSIIDQGKSTPISKVVKNLRLAGDVPDGEEDYFVPMKWIKTVAASDAVKEVGLFGNQNSMAKPTAAKWVHTVARLKQRFNIPDPT